MCAVYVAYVGVVCIQICIASSMNRLLFDATATAAATATTVVANTTSCSGSGNGSGRSSSRGTWIISWFILRNNILAQ